MRVPRTLVIICTLALATLVAACGSNFQDADVPALSLDQPTSPVINLQPPNPPNRTQAQTDINIRNDGKAEMKVTKIQWVDRPERLIMRGQQTEDSCEYDADAPNLDASGNCGDDTYCSYQTSNCVEIGGKKPPFNVDVNHSHVIETLMLPGDNDGIVCPDAPSGRDVPDNYCGELLIETNANNNSGDVADGNLRIFFTFVAGSGQIELEPTNLTFSGVKRGESDSRDLTIENTHADEPLTITDFRFLEYRELFDIEGDSLPTEIAAGSSKTWSVDFTAPDTDEWESDPDALGTELEISSSARNDRVKNVPITVSKQVELPAIVVTPSVLHFHESTEQSFTVSNQGEAPLTMQSLSLDPSTAKDFYEFSIDGEVFDTTIPSAHRVIRPGESVDVDVSFSAGNSADNTIAAFSITYNYYVDSQRYNDSTDGLLLGDVGDAPVGFVHPDAFTFSATNGHTASREFVVRNVGTQTLDITNATFRSNAGSAENFSVDNAVGTIEAGGLKKMTLNYEGDDEMDNVLLEFNSNGAGTSFDLFLVSDPSEQPSDIEAQITPGFANDSTQVGSEASFSARQTNNADQERIEGAKWVLLGRPAGSQAFFEGTGADISFVPDVAGTYEVAVLVHNGVGVGSQTTYSFEAVE